jgi:putative DNA methylase
MPPSTSRLYSVVAVRLEPLLDRNGQPQRYTSGPRAGEIKTRKVRFFRPPNERDLQALQEAERRLQEKWPAWEAGGSSRLNVYLKGRKLVNLSIMACSAGVTFSHRASSLGTLRL